MNIKEQYDLFSYIETDDGSKFCTISASDDGEWYGDGGSYILHSYLTMYKTTGDKGYLYRFILQSLCLMQHRHDYANINHEQRWSDNMYHDGLIIGALAKFVHYIKMENPSLQNQLLYQFPQIQSNTFGKSFSTFWDYADWLQGRVEETLDWYEVHHYWISTHGYKNHAYEAIPVEMNKQVGFAQALLFIGLAKPSSYYLSMLDAIMKWYKVFPVSFYDECAGRSYAQPVMQLNTANNSYWWYHRGWRIETRNCWVGIVYKPKVQSHAQYIEFKEDLKHGGLDVWLAYDFHRLQPASTALDDADMVRFRNTFTKSLYNGNGGFNEAVDGTNSPVSSSSVPRGMFNSFYMPLHQYDGFNSTATTPNVYNIVMDYYRQNTLGKTMPPAHFDGYANLGQAETVKAQWEKECVNLSLYNRSLVYDQDFSVKNKLIIEPASNSSMATSYADPKITAKEFVIHSGIRSIFTAGEKITIAAGFKATAGCTMKALIVTNSCTNGPRPADTSSGIDKNNASASTFGERIEIRNNSMEEFACRVFPNPASDRLEIRISGTKEECRYGIFDMHGKMFSEGAVTIESTADIHRLPSGLYTLKAISPQSGQSISTKFVKE